jgi:hypothetical protein
MSLIGRAKLPHGGCDMEVDGALGNTKHVRNLARAFAGCRQNQYFAFTIAQQREGLCLGRACELQLPDTGKRIDRHQVKRRLRAPVKVGLVTAAKADTGACRLDRGQRNREAKVQPVVLATLHDLARARLVLRVVRRLMPFKGRFSPQGVAHDGVAIEETLAQIQLEKFARHMSEMDVKRRVQRLTGQLCDRGIIEAEPADHVRESRKNVLPIVEAGKAIDKVQSARAIFIEFHGAVPLRAPNDQAIDRVAPACRMQLAPGPVASQLSMTAPGHSRRVGMSGICPVTG